MREVFQSTSRKTRKLLRDPALFFRDYFAKKVARRGGPNREANPRKTGPRSAKPPLQGAATPAAPATQAPAAEAGVSRPGVKARQVPDDLKHVLPGWSVPYLRKLDGVRTVIDVGVLDGTPSLYEAFPDAYLVLVEALPTYEPSCRAILKDREGEVHMCAVGDQDGELTMRQDASRPAVSSGLGWISGLVRAGTDHRVPLRRLDTLLAQRRFESEVLLKIDVQGMECLVVDGATELLKSVKYVIAEGNVKQCYEGENLFADLVTRMKRNGFEVFDIITVTRSRPLTPGATIADTLFVNQSL